MKYKRTFKDPILGQYITFEEDTNLNCTFSEWIEMFITYILVIIKGILLFGLLVALGLGILYLISLLP